MAGQHRRAQLLVASLCAVGCAAAPFSSAHGQGFQLERFEPAAAGSWFFGVEHPWYSSTRYVAAGLTLDYGHNTLLAGTYNADGSFNRQVAIVEHQLVGHIDVAGSFLDRVQLSATLPVVLYEAGTPLFGVAPLDGAAVGDPRVGILVRVWRQPDRDPISIHVGGYFWIPVGHSQRLVGDPGVRGMPQVVLAGLGARHIRWAFSGGVMGRSVTNVGAGPASSIGSELQLRAAIGWADTVRRYNVGPELTMTTAISGDNKFAGKATSLELLVGAQWNVARLVQLGLAVGSGLVPTLGSPDARVIFRAAYAPIRDPARSVDGDHDGVPDVEDACPMVPGVRTKDRHTTGCPDGDHDGVPDAEDTCPESAAGGHPDPARPGGAAKDSDADGVPDAEDLCPTDAAGVHPDAARHGCPPKDSDADGIPDAEDLCPTDAAGAHPDAARHGCPPKDSDADGIPDAEDVCPTGNSGARPDPTRYGCPLPDADHDGIPDAEDACPRLAGAADSDPKKSGCPALAARTASLTELKAVLFKTNQHQLLPESFPILDEVARILRERADLQRVGIEGHADDTGTSSWNLRLSRQRAESVVRYLVKKGISRRRLHAVGFGDTRPLSTDRSDEGRARNRRVEMRIDAEAPKKAKRAHHR